MSETPFMQMYVGDYIASTMHLTTEQHGAYLLLLMTMWRAGAKLPNDPAKLARICRVSPKRWPAIWAEIAEFFTVEDGEISNERLTKEHAKAVSISRERKLSGKKGGEAKALKNKPPTVAIATIFPVAVPKHSHKSEPYREDRETNVSHGPPPVSEAFEAFIASADRKGWPKPKSLTPSRRVSIKARLADAGGLAGWMEALRKAEASAFISGGGTWFSFDWFIGQKNFTKLMEGNYDNRSGGHAPPSSALDEIAFAARAR